MTKPANKGRSAVTNGSRLFLRPVDGRTEEARRFGDLLREIEAEHGGAESMNVVTRAAARAFAQMCVERELMEERRAKGETIDVEVYGQLCDRIDRQGRRLQVDTKTARKPPNSLKARLAARRQGAPE